ncbi:hypothetical protein WANA34_1133 [Wolbachia endosymbiont of Drosophila ananassae]|nr:hypothetical protein WANA34_1133 [Wolbachia endosymbiont of Drosophila ananassae]
MIFSCKGRSILFRQINAAITIKPVAKNASAGLEVLVDK